MRKLLILSLILLLPATIFGQKPFVFFGNAPSDLFSAQKYKDKGILDSGTFLWSLDAVVSGAEITYNKESSVMETTVLSGVGGAVGYKHYKPTAEGEPISNWGISLAVLTKVQLNSVVDTRMKIALLGSLYNITAGPVYTFKDNKIGLLVGANINF